MRIIYKPKGRALEYSPWALNMGTGCIHGCKYCYAPGVLRMDRNAFFAGFTPKKDLLSRVETEAKRFAHKDERILLSFTHDPYQSVEVAALTRQIIHILKDNGCCFQALTKGGDLAAKDFDLYDERDAFATTLTMESGSESAAVEPRAAMPKNRIFTIKQARKKGIKTWVSFEPVLDQFSVFSLYEATKPFVDLYKVGKVSRFRSNIENWSRFGHEIKRRFERDGKIYYLKQDLIDEMKEKEFSNG